MRLDEITGQLRTSDVMRDRAADMKCQVIVGMRPSVFLQLTSTPEIRQQIEGDHLPLHLYNRFVKQGKSDTHPFLKIDYNSNAARVVGHEGRHRAAALMKKGGDVMPVALCLDPDREESDRLGMGAQYKASLDDLPRFIKGQYGGMVNRGGWDVIQTLWDQGRKQV